VSIDRAYDFQSFVSFGNFPPPPAFCWSLCMLLNKIFFASPTGFCRRRRSFFIVNLSFSGFAIEGEIRSRGVLVSAGSRSKCPVHLHPPVLPPFEALPSAPRYRAPTFCLRCLFFDGSWRPQRSTVLSQVRRMDDFSTMVHGPTPPTISFIPLDFYFSSSLFLLWFPLSVFFNRASPLCQQFDRDARTSQNSVLREKIQNAGFFYTPTFSPFLQTLSTVPKETLTMDSAASPK